MGLIKIRQIGFKKLWGATMDMLGGNSFGMDMAGSNETGKQAVPHKAHSGKNSRKRSSKRDPEGRQSQSGNSVSKNSGSNDRSDHRDLEIDESRIHEAAKAAAKGDHVFSGPTPWLDGRVSNGYWDSKDNRHAYMKWLGNLLGYRQPVDWYKIKQRDFKQNRGGGLLASKFNDSVYAAVLEFMPEHEWLPWYFRRTPQGFWKDETNRRAYMKWLEQELEIKSKKDWYRVNKQSFADHGGLGLLQNYYNCCAVSAISEYKPRMAIEEWRFEVAPQGFWKSEQNFQRYMRWLATELGVRTPELWYSVTARMIRENYGSTPLQLRGDSVYRMVSEYLPDFDWKPWLFSTSVYEGYWNDIDNRRIYLEWLGNELGFKQPEDWYALTHDDFKRTGGGGMFRTVYGNSLVRAALERYPAQTWIAAGFQYHSKSKQK